MLKISLKKFLKIILVMFFVGSFVSTSAFGQITGNNSFSTAYNIGYWQYHSSLITKLDVGKDDAFFKFTVNSNDRVYIRVGVDSQCINSGMNVSIYNNSYSEPIFVGIQEYTDIAGRFIFAIANGNTNGQNFFIKVNRGNCLGEIYFAIRIENRIMSSNGTFDFVGTASNPGNPDILTNPNGVDSSIIIMNLTNNSSIPNGAIVKSITTAGTVTPSKGGILHKISSNQNNIWYTSSVLGSNYPITVNDDLEVKKVWSFRYNQKALGASTMKNVKATINYEYDITDGF